MEGGECEGIEKDKIEKATRRTITRCILEDYALKAGLNIVFQRQDLKTKNSVQGHQSERASSTLF